MRSLVRFLIMVLLSMGVWIAIGLGVGVDKKFKSPFAPAGMGASAPSAGRHGALEAVGED